jgi:hypothetical protein
MQFKYNIDKCDRLPGMPQFPLGRSQVTGQATSHGGIQKKSNTCIDCHEGVVHELPPDYEAGEDDE